MKEKSVVVQFRMDRVLKENFELSLKNMGLDMGSAFRMFAMQVLRTRKIPFEVAELNEDELWTKENEEAYKKAKKELENGEAISHDEMKKALGL